MPTNTYTKQGLTFQQLALAEIKPKTTKSKSQTHHYPRKCWWITVLMPDQTIHDYQLSKDLQNACQNSTKAERDQYLMHSVIVIPLTKFYVHQNGKKYADMTIGRIVKIFKRSHTSNSRLITRRQLVKPTYNNWDYPKYNQMFNYLKHDYDRASQERIHDALTKLVKPKFPLGTWSITNLTIISILVFSFIINIMILQAHPNWILTTLLTTMMIDVIVSILALWPLYLVHCPTYKWTPQELESLSKY